MALTSNIKDSPKTPYRYQLKLLPEVFTLAEMRRILGYSTTTAHVTLSRWSQQGLIDPLGQRSGVYFNLEINKTARADHMRLAINKKYPVTRLVGPHVLANYGWTTQRPKALQLALNMAPIKGSTSSRNGYLLIDEIQFGYRSKKWWLAAIEDNASRHSKDTYINGFEAVSPAFALVDMWINRDKDSWFPDPDDLSFDHEEQAVLSITKAAELLHVDVGPLLLAIGLPLPSVEAACLASVENVALTR